MSERLAKRKAEQDAEFKANALNTLANYKPKEDKPWYEDVAGAIGGAIKYVYDNAPSSNPISTPINMGGNAGVSMGGQGTGKSLVTEPVRLAVRRAVGDITAIPRVGEPSPSYTADQIREQGVARGVLGAAIDYSQFIPVVAKGAGFTGDAVNAYKLAMMERQANPFPALRGASNVIDVVPGSRLPSRIVEPPATPATRLGNAMAQMTLDARAAQGGVRDAGVIRFPAGEPTPELPSAQLQREAARTKFGINIQDIEFPPPGKELLRPRMVDTSGYGVFPEGSWPELGLAQYNAGVNNVTMPEEMKALRNYFSNNYDSFQDILRDINNDPTLDITKSIQKQIEQIDNIFRVTSPTTENFKVFRGVIAGSDMPLVNDRPFVGAFYRSLKEGDLIIEPAYMSTSINKIIASEWASSHPDDYLLVIHVPKGSVAVHPIVSWEKGIKEMKTHINAPTEQELLFNRGTVLRIIDNDMGVIHAEMVLPDSTTSNPISTSGIKESLLKKYSYKDLAEMVADEEAKISFYEEHLQSLPDVKDLMTRTKGFLTEKDQQITRQGGYLLPGMIMRDLASTIADLNKYASGSPDPSDYWTFRDIVNQITQANHSRLAKPKDHQHYAKQLLSLLDKHRLLDDDIVQFIQDNLEDVLMLNKPNP